MALRHVTLAGSPPLEVPLDEHVSYLEARGKRLDQLLDAFSELGWMVTTADGVTGARAASRLEAAHDGAMLAVEVADAFCRAVADEREAVEVDIEAVRAAIDSTEVASERVAELRDAVIDEIGRGPVVRSEASVRWERIWLLADQVGANELASQLRRWLSEVATHRAALHPRAEELIEASRTMATRWDAVGRGAFSEVPAVIAAREARERLVELTAELESHLESGSVDRAAALIEDAHARRLRAEEGGRRADVGTARADEEHLLSCYGFAGYPDYQIARSTGQWPDHARGALPQARERLVLATAEVAEAVRVAEEEGLRVASERAMLEDRVRDLAGDVPLQHLLAAPSAADAVVAWCSRRAESITAELAAQSSRIVELRATGAELADEARAREAEARSARHLLEQLDAALRDMSTRRVAAVERIEGLLVDESTPGVVMQADPDQVELADVAAVIERSATQLVIVHPVSSTISGA